MNVDPLSRNKLFKLAVIICCDSKNLTKKIYVYRFKIENKKGKIHFYLPFE